jgi:hypothetical protein
VGLLTRSNARQTNHQHGQCLSKHYNFGLSYDSVRAPIKWNPDT